MLYRLLLLTLFALGAAIQSLAAQASTDIANDLYSYLDIWEGRGYLSQMPIMRPYPEPVLRDALERVIRVGDSHARAYAEQRLRELDGSLSTQLRLTQETRTQDGEQFHAKGAAGLHLKGAIGENVYLAGSLTGILLDVEDGELMPYGQRTDWDIVDDWSSVPFPGGRDVGALNQMRTSFAWGTERLYLHAGIMRRSFGPFHDESVVWSPGVFQQPGFVAYWDGGNVRFTAGLFSLSATQLYRARTPFSENDANTDVIAEGDVPGAEFILDPSQNPGKWVFLQDIRWQARPWLDLAFFESVTWGPRFELAYLTPLKWTFSAQGSVGFADSSKMGLSAVVRPRADLQLPFVLYVDDASFNDLARLNFDTKLKIGMHTGAIWSPESSVLEQLQLDYLALLPYMYTHDGEAGLYEPEPNYTTYTHQGMSIGPGLEPNSDRVQLRARLRLHPRLTTTLTGRMIRHANASEGIADLGLAGNDGTITDDGRYYQFVVDSDQNIFVETGRASYQSDLRFLNQDNIETIYQTGAELRYQVPLTGRVQIAVEAGYEFEYVQDPISWEPTGETAPGVQRDADDPTPPDVVVYGVVAGSDEVNHYAGLRLILTF